jgi:hypothetical protein
MTPPGNLAIISAFNTDAQTRCDSKSASQVKPPSPLITSMLQLAISSPCTTQPRNSCHTSGADKQTKKHHAPAVAQAPQWALAPVRADLPAQSNGVHWTVSDQQQGGTAG